MHEVSTADVYALLQQLSRELSEIRQLFVKVDAKTCYLESRDKKHSNKLEDHDGRIAEFMARITAVEQVTAVRDGYHEKEIEESKAQSWESRTEALDTAHELRGWIRDLVRSLLMALVIAVVILLVLAALLATAGLI